MREEEQVEDLEEVPEMDSPGKTSTSGMSSSICSTPSTLGMGILNAGEIPSRPVSLIFGSLATPLITPFGLPTTHSTLQSEEGNPSKVSTISIDLAEYPGTSQLEIHQTYRRASSHQEMSRPIAFPPATAGASGGTVPDGSQSIIKLTARSLSLSERSKSLPNIPRCVTFCEDPPAVWPCCDGEEYDRTPHPVVIRLSYRDVLELREMKVELGIVTRRQTVVGGSGGGFGARKLSDPFRGGIAGPPGLQFGGSEGRHLPKKKQDEEPNPPSPSALFSSFPSSTRLITGLQRIPDPQPPRPASGMGMSVEPSFGLDSYARTSPSIGGPAGSPGRRGRTISNSSLREDCSSAVGGMGPKRVHRKTSGDLSVQEMEKESEFKAELRAAREELERQEAKEAVARAQTIGNRALSADIRRDAGSGESSISGIRRGGSAGGKARTSSFFDTAPPGATLNLRRGSCGDDLLAPPAKPDILGGLQPAALPAGFTLMIPRTMSPANPGRPSNQIDSGQGPESDQHEGTGGILGRPAGSARADEISALFRTDPLEFSRKPATKTSMTFHDVVDGAAEPRVSAEGSPQTTSTTRGTSDGRPGARRQGSYTSPSSMIRSPSPISAPYTKSFPLSLSSIAINSASPEIRILDTHRKHQQVQRKESKMLQPPSPVLKPYSSSVKAR